jgi:hypothetical protein
MSGRPDMDAAIERILKASCAAQGVPEKITDPAVVAKVAALAKQTSTPASSPAAGRPAEAPPPLSEPTPTGPVPAPATTPLAGRAPSSAA